MTSTEADSDGHDLSEILSKDTVLERAAAGHSTSTGADADRDDIRMTTVAGSVPLRTSVERWGAGLRATSSGPRDTPEDGNTRLAGQLATASETSSATSQQWVYDEARDIEVNDPLWTSSIVEIEPESTNQSGH